jgi:hypothetical protein
MLNVHWHLARSRMLAAPGVPLREAGLTNYNRAGTVGSAGGRTMIMAQLQTEAGTLGL